MSDYQQQTIMPPVYTGDVHEFDPTTEAVYAGWIAVYAPESAPWDAWLKRQDARFRRYNKKWNFHYFAPSMLDVLNGRFIELGWILHNSKPPHMGGGGTGNWGGGGGGNSPFNPFNPGPGGDEIADALGKAHQIPVHIIKSQEYNKSCQILGVDQNAPKDVVVAVYRTRHKGSHPDRQNALSDGKNKDPGILEEESKQWNLAKETIFKFRGWIS